MLDMYKGMANSPETTITNDINAVDTIIYVLDETKVPEELPNLMTLGTGTSAETVKVLEVNGNALTVERGFQGTPRSWNAGTIIARNFTEYDYNALVENVKTLKGNTDTNADDILSLMNYVGNLENLDTDTKTNIVAAINEIYTKFNEHELENIKHRRIFIGDEPVDPEINDIWLDLNPQRIILADWRMNETVGNIIQDYSGNGYHAIAEGGIAITDPINPLSAKSRTGDGITGVIRTQFNATAGLNNFKVEAFVKLNSIQTGFVSIVNNYRNASNYAAGWHLSHHDEYGVAARVVATEKSTIGPGGELYSGFILEPEKVYKLELEFDGLIATLRIYEFVGNKLILLYSGSEEAIGTLQTDMLPLTMLANNSEPTGEFSTFTIGRVRITTLMV